MGHSKDAIKKINDWCQERGLASRGSDYGSQVCWTLIRGSAEIRVYVDKNDDDDEEQPFITVVSPLVTVPPALKTLELFEYCMVANASIRSFTLSFFENSSSIALVHDRPCEGLDTSELEYIVGYLGHLADKYDNILVEQFGCISPNINTDTSADSSTNTMESIGA